MKKIERYKPTDEQLASAVVLGSGLVAEPREKGIETADGLLRRLRFYLEILREGERGDSLWPHFVRRAVATMHAAKDIADAHSALCDLVTSLNRETPRNGKPPKKKKERKSTTTIKEDSELLERYERDYSNCTVSYFAQEMSDETGKKIEAPAMRAKLKRARDARELERRKSSGRS
jgi:hypothetical protein